MRSDLPSSTRVAWRPTGRVASDERGVALPMALIALVILMAMTFAFAMLARSEPTISRNQTLRAQARALAESGVELAIWALTNPTASSIAFSGSQANAPYNGAPLLPVSGLSGGVHVEIDTTSSPNEYAVTAIGWAPTDSASDPRTKGVAKVRATLYHLDQITPRCALCAMGSVQVAGNSTIDARSNFCGSTTPSGGTMTAGTTTVQGNASVYGPGNSVANEPADTPASQPASAFTSSKMTADDFAALRELAKANGTYYTGSVTFDGSASHPMPNGIIFVDTTTGSDLTSDTPSNQVASVSISGNVSWSGWLIVAGSISVSGSVNLTGTLYAQDDFEFTGNGTVQGAVVSENRVTQSGSVVNTAVTGTANITYDCPNARSGGGTVNMTGYMVLPGSYMEVDNQH